MLQTETILFFSFAYICLLFAIAYYGDKRADMGTSIISNPYIYALSMAVYCTAWTFYGSVGRAATSGPNFLTIYIGPTLMFAAGWFVLRKIIRIVRLDKQSVIRKKLFYPDNFRNDNGYIAGYCLNYCHRLIFGNRCSY